MSVDHPDDDWDGENRSRRRDWWHDEERRPRRSRFDEQADDYDEYADDSEEAARASVSTPALLLIIGAVLSLLFSLLLIVVGILIALNALQGEQIVGYIYAGAGVILVAYFIVMLIGAIRMKNLQSHTFALASAIMAIVSIMCLGLCSVLVVPFGIWALVVLLNANVKRQFELAKYRVSDDEAGL